MATLQQRLWDHGSVRFGAAVLLLVAIIAAIALTLRRRKDSRHMDAGEQVRVRAADRLSLVKMPAESKDR